MLYHLYLLKPLFSPLNIFQYITFRAAGAFLTALFISLVTGPSIIRWLRSKKTQKHLRRYARRSIKPKRARPAMGGLIILLGAMMGACF